jgi:mono/diheme cytochrome c family protein
MSATRLLLLAAIPGATMATALYSLPAERPVPLPAGVGRELVEAHCSACHSLDYITTQPPGLGPDHWRKSVEKMVTIHGAEIPPQDRAVIEAYLARTFP